MFKEDVSNFLLFLCNSAINLISQISDNISNIVILYLCLAVLYVGIKRLFQNIE